MNCPHCLKQHSGLIQSSLANSNFKKAGYFFRLFDRKRIQRYKCLTCLKTYSSETIELCKYQKKRHLNQKLYFSFCSGLSQRRLALLYNINLKTVARKFHFMGEFAVQKLKYQDHIPYNYNPNCIVFDDMETFEHTKCKPLSITLVVEEKKRFILGFKVSSMAAKGHLAKIAVKKYGKRRDDRRKNRKLLLSELKQKLCNFKGTIKSDCNPHYIPEVKKYFPDCEYKTFLGGRGAIVGQGELKKLGFDPLFSLNHTAAMLRANINRLFRRTWNTTKKAISLEHHIAMYVWFHNEVLIAKKKRKKSTAK